MDDPLTASLKETIAYALGRSLPKVPKRTVWRGVDPVHISIAADAVIEQLRLCGFKIEKSPPLKLHRNG
jgi:hypothetical protein